VDIEKDGCYCTVLIPGDPANHIKVFQNISKLRNKSPFQHALALIIIEMLPDVTFNKNSRM
jgi:hypothetical protein